MGTTEEDDFQSKPEHWGLWALQLEGLGVKVVQQLLQHQMTKPGDLAPLLVAGATLGQGSHGQIHAHYYYFEGQTCFKTSFEFLWIFLLQGMSLAKAT